jgi:hypothetical protein
VDSEEIAQPCEAICMPLAVLHHCLPVSVDYPFEQTEVAARFSMARIFQILSVKKSQKNARRIFRLAN